MKYICSVLVNLERETCIKLWFDEDQLHKWQTGFQYKKWMSGKSNQEGAISEILIIQGKFEIKLKETILENDLPRSLTGQYDHIHMSNTQKVRFESIAEDKTEIITEVEYFAFHKFLPRMLAFLFPGMYRKQSQKWLDQFKTFAEST